MHGTAGLLHLIGVGCALMFDADNDGYKDIYVCNGIYKDETNLDFINFFANDIIQKMALTGKKKEMDDIINKIPSVPQLNKFYHNNKILLFLTTVLVWVLISPSFSNGAAYGISITTAILTFVVNNVNQEAFIYRSNANNHRQPLSEIEVEGIWTKYLCGWIEGDRLQWQRANCARTYSDARISIFH